MQKVNGGYVGSVTGPVDIVWAYLLIWLSYVVEVNDYLVTFLFAKTCCLIVIFFLFLRRVINN